MATFAIRPFILLFPLIVIVLALVFGGRTARWIVGGFCCVLLVSVLFLLGVRQAAEVRVASVDMPPTVVESPVPSNTPQIPPTPYLYQPGNSYLDPNDRNADRARTDQLDPNIFPSVETAALQCARKVITRFSEKFMAESEKRAIQVDARQLPLAAPLILATLEKEFGWLRFTVLENPTTHPESGSNHLLILKLSASYPDKPRRKTNVQTSVSARLNGPGVQLEWRKTALNKGWVENLTDWKSREGISSPLIVIDPPFLSASSAESKNRAIQLASQKVAEYVRAHPTLQSRPMGDLENFLQGELRRGKLVRDEFLQRFERSYGVVYRDALLLDVSDEQVAVLAQQYGAISAVQSRHLNRNVASAVGLVLLIVVVYLFLNAATKGYYVWSLRLGSVAIIAAGIYTVVRLT